MADLLVKDTSLTAVANAIRAKTGGSSPITFPNGFESAIGDMIIPSGNQDIDTLYEYDVAAKATARISATERAKIIPENIAKDITILGVTGTHEGSIKPSYCFNDGDEITDMYFNTASDLSDFLSGLEYTETDPYFGYDACPLGLGFYGVDYGGYYGLVWEDEIDGIELYTTDDGWIESEFSPTEPFEVDLSELDVGFAEIIDYVVATEYIAFGDHGIFPTGNQDIENLNLYGVYDKSTAQISATERAKIIPENIADGVTILGVTGTHSGGGTVEGFITFSSNSPFTLGTTNNTPRWSGTIEYSTDKSNWSVWSGTTPISSVNNVLYLRGTNIDKLAGNSYPWILTGTDIECKGNIETLIDYQTVMSGYHVTLSSGAFAGLFKNCTALIKAPDMPSTVIPASCYSSMYYGCTSLRKAPDLPAKVVPQSAYAEMFYGCTSLAEPPSLSHITTFTGINCCEGMFSRCTAINKLPKINATTFSTQCLWSMFSYDTLIKVSETQTGEYVNEYRLPYAGTGTAESNSFGSFLYNTGGTFTSNLTVNTTYYTSNGLVD